jgi:tyrosine-protein kinase Etk/Wzc
MEQNYQEMYDEQEIKLSDYIHIIQRFKWLSLSIFLIVCIGAFVYTYRAPRIYKATSKILLEDNKSTNLLFSPISNQATSINNNIQIIQSTPVMKIAHEIMQNDDAYPAFPINGTPEEPVNPIGYLKDRVTIDNERETDILAISYESTNPREAMAMANATAYALIQDDTDNARTEFRRTREFLENQLDEKERLLRLAEEDLRIYKIDNKISLLSEETIKLIEQSSDLEKLLAEAQTEYEVSSNHLAFLKKELVKQDTMLADVNAILTTPLLEKLRQEIVQNQTRYVNLLTKSDYPPDHPELVNLNRSIESAKKQLNAEIQRVTLVKAGSSDPLAYRSDLIAKISQAQIEENLAESKVTSLEEAVDDYNRRMAVLPDTEIQLARLERNYRINEKIYSMLMEKFEDAKIAEKSKIGNVRIIEEAGMPDKPIKPNKKMNYLIGIVLGLGLGIGAALLIHSLDTKLRTFDDVKQHVMMKVLGTIPFVHVFDADIETIEKQLKDESDPNEKILIKDHLQHVQSRLISSYAPKASASEAFRTLRTSIVAARKSEGPQTILVTSSGPGEGKSTILSNLAITLAQMDARVIEVDLDLRRPVVHTFFGLNKENGISDFLMDKKQDLKPLIRKTSIKNLDVITSGMIPPNPSELLSSSRLDEMISILKKHYDYILMDAPPVIAVTDSLILSNKVDIRALVIRINQADKAAVKRAKELLDNINIEIDGCVVNGVFPQKYYSASEYYYYYYYYYYHEGSKKKRKKRSEHNSYINNGKR